MWNGVGEAFLCGERLTGKEAHYFGSRSVCLFSCPEYSDVLFDSQMIVVCLDVRDGHAVASRLSA